MNIIVTISTPTEVWEIQNSIESLSLESSMYDSPSVLTFDLIDSSKIYPNGSAVSLVINGENIFKGFIFKYEINEKKTLSITAYDQMRYLKNQDTIYYSNKTASQIFEDICNKNGLNCNVVNPSNWIVLEYLHDKKTMFEIVKHSIEESFRMENKLYMIRDNFGILEFIDVSKNKTNIQLGTKSLMTSYTAGLSIDDDTYNVVKLIRDNKDTQKRDVWMELDSDNVKKWGKLQFLGSVDENANEEQIKELARNILKVKNKEKRTFSFSAIGFYNLRAGDGIKIVIDDIVNEWFIISKITTNIKRETPTMDIEVMLNLEDN